MGLEHLRQLNFEILSKRRNKRTRDEWDILTYSDIKTLDSRVSRLIKSGVVSESLNNLLNSKTGEFISKKGFFSKSKFNKVLEQAINGDMKSQAIVEGVYNSLAVFTRERPKGVADTSTVRGAKQVEKQIDKRIEGYSKMSKKSKSKIWDTYNSLKDFYEGGVGGFDSTQLQQLITKVFQSEKKVMSLDELRSKVQTILDTPSVRGEVLSVMDNRRKFNKIARTVKARPKANQWVKLK